MNIERFSQLVSTYGGKPERWPEEERTAAITFLSHSSEAMLIRQQALQLDCLLSSVSIAGPSADLQKRIMTRVLASAKSSHDFWQTFFELIIGTTAKQRLWRPALVFGLPLLLGIAVSVFTEKTTTPLQETVQIEEVNLLALDTGEFLELSL